MSRTKAMNFIHSYKGYMLIGGFILIVVGFVLDYIYPKPGAAINTDWLKGSVPTMSFVGLGLILIPYIALYTIQTIASKFGKTPPPQG